MGTNHDEFTMFAALRYMKLDREVRSAEYPHMLADIFGADDAPILAHYPPDHYGGDVSLAYSAAVTDGVFACTADRLADSLSRNAPVYAYEFDDPHAPAPKLLRDAPFRLAPATHWSCGTCSTSAVRRRWIRATSPVRPDDQLLEPFRHQRRTAGRRSARLAGSNRRSRPQLLDVVASRRQQGHHQLRSSTPVPVLGVAEGQIVSTPEPDVFAKDWSAAWNRRDVEAVLRHFHDDVVFTSPVAS